MLNTACRTGSTAKEHPPGSVDSARLPSLHVCVRRGNVVVPNGGVSGSGPVGSTGKIIRPIKHVDRPK